MEYFYLPHSLTFMTVLIILRPTSFRRRRIRVYDNEKFEFGPETHKSVPPTLLFQVPYVFHPFQFRFSLIHYVVERL